MKIPKTTAKIAVMSPILLLRKPSVKYTEVYASAFYQTFTYIRRGKAYAIRHRYHQCYIYYVGKFAGFHETTSYWNSLRRNRKVMNQLD